MKMTRKRQADRRRHRHGFTLMEVLLVMAILVMLGALVVSNFMGIFAKSKVDTATTQMVLFKTPLDTYQLHMGSYPSTDIGLQALRESPSDAVALQKYAGPYLKAAIPKDPWGGDYQYELVTDPASGQAGYKIWSNGPDQQSGNDDDVQVTSY